jgi:serine/threonine protein kinase
MQIEKVFQVVDKFYLVFPLCTGGELYDAVVRRGHFTERKAARIIRDVISALQALHEYNVLHLDIKPENILFESDEPNARVKITDFGLSKIFTPETVELQNRARPTDEELAARAESFINCGNFNADHVRGTFGYMSPELILSGASLWMSGAAHFVDSITFAVYLHFVFSFFFLEPSLAVFICDCDCGCDCGCDS